MYKELNNNHKLHSVCIKGGVKIHDSTTINNNINNININNSKNNNTNLDPLEFYNKLKNENKHTGIRITKSDNDNAPDPFSNFTPFKNEENKKNIPDIKYNKSSYNNIDLNLENYSREDLFNLFGIKKMFLTEDIMREAKKIVLKTHPDKSQLEPKYFLFFSKAYKRLYGIYEFQNKSENKISITKKQYVEDINESSENGKILEKMFEKNKQLKNPRAFNEWFNEQFEKHKLDDTNENGYGEWLKSDEGIINVGNISQANLNSEIEKQKKHVQSLTVYNGVNEMVSPAFSGTALINNDSNYTSNSLFSNDGGVNYTDLKQAYVETVIPVTQEDYAKIPKYKNMEEYKKNRDAQKFNPIDKEEAIRELVKQQQLLDEQSTALAFHFAKEAEKTKKSQENFWSGLKQLTNW